MSQGEMEGETRANNEASDGDALQGTGEQEICRDYLRNVCRKGDRCRYKHPDRSNLKSLLTQLSVCQDFQHSRSCRRERCKYIHITVDEQAYIEATGRVPKDMEPARRSIFVGDIPVCADFLHGNCTRGDSCKYVHDSHIASHRKHDHSTRFEPYSRAGGAQPARAPAPTSRYHDDIGLGDIEEELYVLRHQMTRLRRRIAELKVSNDGLVAENAQLKVISARRSGSLSAARTAHATPRRELTDSYSYPDGYGSRW